MTIDLGFAWMTLPGGQQLAFVDVPGHERFVPNMLAGLGPVPAVLFVVAADGGWMPQSAEHLAAIDAQRVRHGLLVVTRADVADPGPALRRGAAELAATSLGAVEALAVSAVTGAGLPELREALARLAASMEAPDAGRPVRIWLDRSFTIKGAGTVVTGTLPAGTVRTGQELLLTPALLPVRVRSIQALGEPAEAVTGVARVALNLRGVPPDVPERGMALVQAGRWTMTSQVDVRLDAGAAYPPGCPNGCRPSRWRTSARPGPRPGSASWAAPPGPGRGRGRGRGRLRPADAARPAAPARGGPAAAARPRGRGSRQRGGRQGRPRRRPGQPGRGDTRRDRAGRYPGAVAAARRRRGGRPRAHRLARRPGGA